MGNVIITRFVTCPVCGKSTEVTATLEQWQKYDSREGLVHDIFPDMPREQREVLLSGICPKCWDELFGIMEEPDESDYDNAE